jgi:hypothetical protein
VPSRRTVENAKYLAKKSTDLFIISDLSNVENGELFIEELTKFLPKLVSVNVVFNAIICSNNNRIQVLKQVLSSYDSFDIDQTIKLFSSFTDALNFINKKKNVKYPHY